MKPTYEELRNRFVFQPCTSEDQARAHEKVSESCLELATLLNGICPAGRNHSLMLTALEDVRMRANAALACDSPPPEATPAE